MLLDLQVLLDQLGLREPQVLRGLQDQPELRVLLGQLVQVQRDLPGLLVLQVLLDPLDQPELQDQLGQVQQDLPGLLELQVLLDLLVLQGQLVQVQQDLPGLVELQVLPDLLDQPELQGLPDRLLHQF